MIGGRCGWHEKTQKPSEIEKKEMSHGERFCFSLAMTSGKLTAVNVKDYAVESQIFPDQANATCPGVTQRKMVEAAA